MTVDEGIQTLKQENKELREQLRIKTESHENAMRIFQVTHDENKSLKKEIRDLKQAALTEAHAAILPFIAGGSEYTGTSGLVRAIKEVGEDRDKAVNGMKREIIARKELEKQIDVLRDDMSTLVQYLDNPFYRDCWDNITTGEGIQIYESMKDYISGSLHNEYLLRRMKGLEEALQPFANIYQPGSMLKDDDFISPLPVLKEHVEVRDNLVPVHAFRKAAELTKQTSSQSPTIVCLCGSTRFMDAYQQANLTETLNGNIVLTVGCDMKSDADLFADKSEEELEQIKQRLDWLHKRKIDLADEILVLNVGGYIGDSTRSEIEYAKQLGKTIRYLESESAE